MAKKEYSKPELTFMGDVEELTKGEGFGGSSDQFWRIRWGPEEDPTSGN